MLVSDAARQLNMNTQTLRLALQQGLFPFGVAVKTSENRFTYYINPKRLEVYLKGLEFIGNETVSDYCNESTDSVDGSCLC